METPAPTQEWLERAFRFLRRPHWTVTLDDYLRDPIHEKLVHSLARWLQAHPQADQPKKPPKLTGKYTSRTVLRPGELDMKRRASGEREDD